jgi:hypothetical protein
MRRPDGEKQNAALKDHDAGLADGRSARECSRDEQRGD